MLQLQASDPDVHEDDYKFNYRILNDDDDCPFKIVKTTGLIQTKERLDRELQAQYILDVEVSEVTESHSHALKSRTPVIINLLDGEFRIIL